MQSPAKIVKSAWLQAGKQIDGKPVSLKTFARLSACSPERSAELPPNSHYSAAAKWLKNKAKLHSQRRSEAHSKTHSPSVYVSQALRRGDRCFAAKGGC